ncbi:JAB domain-containing protein [Candidatus Rariloculus sp.]|uniref:JAB domain-containing protein n=1 Tax=Candidatus Rariloculus sp. TaxID=3101265 RepID=UPI003D0C3087
MPASNTARSSDNCFQSLSPASLSRTEKSSVIKLALAVLSARYRPGRAFTSPEDVEGFLRLKLTGRRNEVFGIVYLDTRHRLIEIAELFNGTVDGAAVYPRVVVQQALEKNAAAVVLFHNHPLGGKQVVNLPMISSVLRKILGDDRMQLRQHLTAWSSCGRLDWLMCVPSS